MAALSLDPEPPAADEGAPFPVARGEGLKDAGQALVGEGRDVIIIGGDHTICDEIVRWWW